MASSGTSSQLKTIIDHVFLPPKLPGGDDEGLDDWETQLVAALAVSLEKFGYYEWPQADSASLKQALGAVEAFRNLSGAGPISATELTSTLARLWTEDSVIPLHVRRQNAGILLRSVGGHVFFECFELSPTNSSVFANKGRLRRQFPAATVCMPRDTLAREGFCAAISTLIGDMSAQSVAEMQPQIKKARRAQVEDRDTVNPAIVTQLLTAVLRPFGEMVSGRGLWKNTREEVRYEHGNRLPWRRSPIWLLLRVILQLTLAGEEFSYDLPPRGRLYKRFMVYFMAHVLKLSLDGGRSSSALHVMNAKLARRLIKLDIKQTEPWMRKVHETMKNATAHLRGRWAAVVKDDSRSLEFSGILKQSMDQECKFSLPELERFLDEVGQGVGLDGANNFRPSSAIIRLSKHALPSLQSAQTSGDYRIYNIVAFENWVTYFLRDWIEEHLEDEDTGEKLYIIMKEYRKFATNLYKSKPEGQSIMTLTLLELWVACDRSAVAIHSLLRDYNPEVPIEVCASLLLRSRVHMDRLAAIEEYVQERRRQVTHVESIFTTFGTSRTFGVRYYHSSPKQQQLLSQIEWRAREEQEKKRNQFRALKTQYNDLIVQAASLSHESITRINKWGDKYLEHVHYHCQKCRLGSIADNLQIYIHEWPLPSDETAAKATVFELDVPRPFRFWRDCTHFMHTRVLGKGGSCTEGQPYIGYLSEYQGLKEFMDGGASEKQRVVLASNTKPNVATHRDAKDISISEEYEICLENGMSWGFFDREENNIMEELNIDSYVAEACTFVVPRSLQPFLNRPWSTPDGLDPNMVIASQSKCPDNLSTDEFKALCSLPLGHGVIWENLLKEFAMPSVDWGKVETALFAWQISHQAGPSLAGSVLRSAHKGLEDEALVLNLLREMSKCLNHLKENWECLPAVATFTIITARLLSLTIDLVANSCLDLLSSCRQTCFAWMQTLRGKVSAARDDAHLQNLTRRLLETALACSQTFDVDARYLKKMLQNPDAVSVFIESCITIQESLGRNRKNATGDVAFLPSLELSHQRLLFLTESPLMDEITSGGNLGLDLAIAKIWPSYNRAKGESWTEQASCWVQTTSASQDGTSRLQVHYNVLTAELLVNGLPLSRLPSDYELHENYPVLFGRSSVEVMPSAERGMKFSTRCEIQGYKIHLSLQNNDLLIRACKGENAWELVPSRVFYGAFPSRFIHSHVHWYDVANEVIEFRRKDQPWKPDERGWKLLRHECKWRLECPNTFLINPSSKTACRLSEVFKPLEQLPGLHISFERSTGCLEIDIPRLQLSFYIEAKSSDIMSRQYRGMRVDSHQTIGTLIGLVDKLVLAKVGGNLDRSVLIPDWAPSCQKNQRTDHVTVAIPSSATRVEVYQLDHHLHRLTGNGSLKSKLFLAELHGLTSSCVPDPFTLHTGTEEALTILRSEGVRSFTCLSQEEIDLLKRISQLSPERSFYPANLKVMQVVDWGSRGLSPLSQHVDFSRSVRALFIQAEETSFFYSDFVQPPPTGEVRVVLEAREAIRSSVFYRDGFGAEAHTMDYDALYSKPRDGGQDSQRARDVSNVAAIFRDSDVKVPFQIPQDFAHSLYQNLTGLPILPPRPRKESICLSFNPKWLDNPWPALTEEWRTIQLAIEGIAGRNPNDYFALLPWIVSIAFAQPIESGLLSTLGGLIFHPKHRVMVFPQNEALDLDKGYKANRNEIEGCVNSCAISFESSGWTNGTRLPRETNRQAHERRERQYLSYQAECVHKFSNEIYEQWPCQSPSVPTDPDASDYIHIHAAMEQIRTKFKSWYHNHQFFQSIESMCASLRQIPVRPTRLTSVNASTPPPTTQNVLRHVMITDLFKPTGISSLPEVNDTIQPPTLVPQSETSNGLHLVSALKRRIATIARLPQEIRYLNQLSGSIDQLRGNVEQRRLTTTGEELFQSLHNYYQLSLENYDALLSAFKVTFSSRLQGENSISSLSMVESTDMWPSVSPRLILMQLNRANWKSLPLEWKEAVVNFGCCVSQLQGSERLLQLHGQEADLVKEISNFGPRTWNPIDHPDSLLLEIEGNLRIRKAQQQIAETMENPPALPNKNAVMQLNMGEGKSSVIVPTVAAALGDGTGLVRVIVAKPQSRQMFEMLVSRLGGLIGRRIYHMPFSRSLRPSAAQAKFLEHHYGQCRDHGGVLLVQPENLLSLQLMIQEAAFKEDEALSSSLLRIQRNFFDQFARDIIDESDENFSVKFELIYTMGLQGPIDYAPGRWIIVQQVLGLVAKYAPTLLEQFPKSIEIHSTSTDRYPRIRFLSKKASDEVLRLVVDHICETGLLPGFPISRQSKEYRDMIRHYITESNPCPDAVASVEEGAFWDMVSESILLIRGLFASGILEFVFAKKRWRVNYGLDATRDPQTRLAVPYRAKDSPSPRSEFSHPDVVICLTSISYYYGGLTDDELFLAFERLLLSDQADGEYQDWVKSVQNLPESFRQLNGVNIRDRQLCINRLFPHLRYSKGVIDYFLSKIVFVKEMKEFPYKLSASGWDLGRVKSFPATGFSGTNDSQHVLPLTVKQLDLPDQKHTNALVLENLLRPENSVSVLSQQPGHTAVWDAMQLLKMTVRMDPETRVILDVGAQIIDLANEEVAKAWLHLARDKTEIQGVVFCSDNDELSVLDRQGHVERLQTSPFAKHLDACLVFLDEAHTRGIDLRLPQNYRAAVTLGANLVKDRLVQACMRMRKLGNGQSVVFYVPEEIETKIRSLNSSNGIVDGPITVLEVLTWSISETWADLRRSFPLWATQGKTFAQQQELWQQVSGSADQQSMDRSLAEEFLEEEAQSLESRYRPRSQRDDLIDEGMGQSQNPMLQQIYHKYCEFSDLDANESSLQEEQERELAPEIEEERQKERAEPAKPQSHKIHKDVRHFVLTGLITPLSNGFRQPFDIFKNTSAAAEFDVSQWPKGLLVTADFARTIRPDSIRKSYMDDYLRNIQWILTSSVGGSMKMVVISPYEANKLRDKIASSKAVIRHIYAARQNQGFAPIDSLDLYTLPGSVPRQEIPGALIIELNLFAGQLYFRSFKEYTKVCDYLGLAWKAAEEGEKVMPDGFIERPIHDQTCGFGTSPVKFLKIILTKIRFNCEGIEKTHLGKVLEGALLTEDDFPDDDVDGSG